MLSRRNKEPGGMGSPRGFRNPEAMGNHAHRPPWAFLMCIPGGPPGNNYTFTVSGGCPALAKIHRRDFDFCLGGSLFPARQNVPFRLNLSPRPREVVPSRRTGEIPIPGGAYSVFEPGRGAPCGDKHCGKWYHTKRKRGGGQPRIMLHGLEEPKWRIGYARKKTDGCESPLGKTPPWKTAPHAGRPIGEAINFFQIITQGTSVGSAG